MNRFSNQIQKLPNDIRAVRVFTDGACWPNPGPFGGWSFIIQYQDDRPEFKMAGADRDTTNNRMELMAVIQALKSLTEPHIVELVTDSEYVGKGIVYWMNQWKKTGWRQKNSDLWIALYNLVNYHDVYITCIRGHTGQEQNEQCDKMAGEALNKLRGNNV